MRMRNRLPSLRRPKRNDHLSVQGRASKMLAYEMYENLENVKVGDIILIEWITERGGKTFQRIFCLRISFWAGG